MLLETEAEPEGGVGVAVVLNTVLVAAREAGRVAVPSADRVREGVWERDTAGD